MQGQFPESAIYGAYLLTLKVRRIRQYNTLVCEIDHMRKFAPGVTMGPLLRAIVHCPSRDWRALKGRDMIART